ncbi:coiled-coil domain-containing protein 43-like [Tropilaelaps mercedesae]|uniref:Coiled-coil domain-containing protein 43 n=1 Tax=Tropilaelaps mercedesae TaxID=418985 RepID=A0A1V9X538_9ACAR|nr:coiled-coil domain-containing protein 43-like [Tropilaelaps mercedesae]
MLSRLEHPETIVHRERRLLRTCRSHLATMSGCRRVDGVLVFAGFNEHPPAYREQMSEFEQWLYGQLTALKVDADVFTSYIQGILDGDESHDEKIEAIEGILCDACPDTAIVSSTTNEILNRFAQEVKKDSSESGDPVRLPTGSGVAFDDQVKSIFSQKTAKAAETAEKKTGRISEEDDVKRLKSTILNQYAQVEVELDEDPEATGDNVIKAGDQTSTKKSDPAGSSAKRKGPLKEDPLMMKNTNAQAVLEAEKLKREKSKQESEAKKAKDKLDRETQKKKEAERKEKEKQRTQKGERRR